MKNSRLRITDFLIPPDGWIIYVVSLITDFVTTILNATETQSAAKSRID